MAAEPKRRIMVVDDDADIRMIIEAALSDKYEVTHAHDGLDALQKLEIHEPDFIIMDLVMPLMNGLEACEAIRKNPHFQQIQVLFLSAHDSREEIAKTYESGGNLFLSKPIDPNRLMRNIDIFFEKNPPPVRGKKMSLLQIKLLEKGGKKQGGGSKPQIPRRAMAPQPAPRKKPEPRIRREVAVQPGSLPAAPSPQTSLPPRILVVEDDKDLAQLIGLALENIFEIVMSHDGLDAIEKIVKYQPDILIIDVMLPKMNGYQLCQSVRANRSFRNKPVIFVTAKSSERDREYALKVGGDAFLAKPFDMKELVMMCRKMTFKEGFQVAPKSISIDDIRVVERQAQKTAGTGKMPFDREGKIS